MHRLAFSVVMLAVLKFSPSRAEATGHERRAVARSCDYEVRLRQPLNTNGCWVDVEMAHPGRLTLPCDGADGAASATFGSRHFQGRATHGNVSLSLRTSFHYGDGCDWQTQQTIRGQVPGSDLRFHYDEHPRPRQNGCSPSCSVDGLVQVITSAASAN